MPMEAEVGEMILLSIIWFAWLFGLFRSWQMAWAQVNKWRRVRPKTALPNEVHTYDVTLHGGGDRGMEIDWMGGVGDVDTDGQAFRLGVQPGSVAKQINGCDFSKAMFESQALDGAITITFEIDDSRPRLGDLVQVLATGELGMIEADRVDSEPYKIESLEGDNTWLYSVNQYLWFKETEVSLLDEETIVPMRRCALARAVGAHALVQAVMLAVAVLGAARCDVSGLLCMSLLFCTYAAHWQFHEYAPALLGVIPEMLPVKMLPPGRFVFPLVGMLWIMYLLTLSLVAVLSAVLLMLWASLAALVLAGWMVADNWQTRSHALMTALLWAIAVFSVWKLGISYLVITVCLFFVGVMFIAGSSWTGAALPPTTAQVLNMMITISVLWLAALLTSAFVPAMMQAGDM
eukprot:CAMPEP_0179026876 /NCGR_PEP_ID=MMETSP0796-20121207/8745_1 /TAXON_ID=73915 /ORGANISM="Pyrodinium bahamense, Strain pbaha01" /LENGTH=403 /DNA_ID=CAMNT_0020722979 /DNA_START=57 /DNA_END=1268 /DNA_ORIENTATION=-